MESVSRFRLVDRMLLHASRDPEAGNLRFPATLPAAGLQPVRCVAGR